MSGSWGACHVVEVRTCRAVGMGLWAGGTSKWSTWRVCPSISGEGSGARYGARCLIGCAGRRLRRPAGGPPCRRLVQAAPVLRNSTRVGRDGDAPGGTAAAPQLLRLGNLNQEAEVPLPSRPNAFRLARAGTIKGGPEDGRYLTGLKAYGMANQAEGAPRAPFSFRWRSPRCEKAVTLLGDYLSMSPPSSFCRPEPK